MENSDKDVLLLQSLSQTQSEELNTDVTSEPEQEQQVESEPDTESNQEKPEPSPPPLANIMFRIQQLHNRRFLLLQTQNFRTRAGYNSGRTTEEMTCEDSDELCELEAIQKELEELLVKKEELEKQEHSSDITLNKLKEDFPNLHTIETPRGGVYTLPPLQLNQEDITLEQIEIVKTEPTAEIPIDHIVPVDSLGQTSVVTRCPSCDEIISTETRSSASDAMWLLCCLCSMMGCVAGCCLIPFFTDSLRKVDHQCPHCWAHIHTYQPF